jgi:DNA polymerase-3 subunit epsilon
MDFITIDFETATPDRHSPCEIGLTEVRDSQIVGTKSWLIKPHSYPYFDNFNMSIHGITPNDVKDAPTFPELWPELEPLISDQFLIAHNAGFDMSVLRKTLEKYSIAFPTFQYSCSYIFSKKVWLGLPSYGLKSLCRLNDISFEHHRAGADSEATAKLCLKAFKEKEVSSIDEFPVKLKTTIGQLYSGGYKSSVTKRDNSGRTAIEVVGDSDKHNPESIFYGSTVVFTGALMSMARVDAHQIIADIGGVIGKSVNKSTDFLIVGQQDFRVVGDEGMSSKQKKAITLIDKGSGMEVISEDEFIANT